MMSLSTPRLPWLLLLATLLSISHASRHRNIVPINDQVALEVISDDIFRVLRCPVGCNASQMMQERSSLVVLDEARDETVKYTVETNLDRILRVSTKRMTAVTSAIPTTLLAVYYDDTPIVMEKTYQLEDTVTQTFSVTDSHEAIYGGGQFVNGFLNYRSAPILLAQANTEAAVPFVLSSKQYGILWDHYGETLMNPPQQEIRLDPTTFAGTFTPKSNGAYWFYLVACHDDKWGCGNDPVRVTLTDRGSSRVVCEHALANLPRSTTCRVEGLTKETTYKVTFEGAHAERKLFVTSVETHNQLTFQTQQTNPFIDYYIVASSTTEGVLVNYRKLTGPAPLYPKWVYGFWQCKEHYHNQTELLQAAAQFRARQIPVDAIVQDWHYWGDLGWGPQWDSKLYPSPQSMVETLHAAKIRFMVSVWSRFDQKTKFYKEMNRSGVLINASTYMDAWNPVAQQFFYKYVQEAHFFIGVDALWLDATEPENHDEKGQAIFLGAGDDYANTFSLMVTQTVHKGLKQQYPHRRVFSLTRSSFAGQQRSGAALWSGDTTASWDSLRRQIALSINYQLSGMPYWSMDTGGFFRPKDQYTNHDYQHLLIRWFQFAVFTPLFRVHGSHSDTELWNYGPAVQDTIVETAIRFRYRLLEYIYSGFWKVETEHSTMQRGLLLDFEQDEQVYNIADQFMFGPSFLVAPIYHSNSSRSIYLPKLLGGSKWRCFYSGNQLPGGQSLWWENVTISRIPLFVRSSILILGPDGRQHVDDNNLDGGKLEVRVYDGANSHFELFEDDGVSSDPNRATTTIAFAWDEPSRTLTIGGAQGAAPKRRTINVVLVRPGAGVGIDPVVHPDASLEYDGTTVRIHLSRIDPRIENEVY